MADDTLERARTAAVAAAATLWKQGIREDRRGATDEIARDAGWGDSIAKREGGTWEWCGMFVAASLYRAGLCRALRRGFFHTRNVRDYFTYRWCERVPRWVWDDAARAWHAVDDYHAARGAARRWTDADAVRATPLAALDAGPGDVVLIDHEGDGAPNHIALVERYEPAAGLLVTLEGNARGTAALRMLPGGEVEVGAAPGDAVVRNERDLTSERARRKVFGVGRLSAVDFEDRAYDGGERAPRSPPKGRG